MSPEELERQELRAKLLGSPLLFTQFFYKLMTGRDFIITYPTGRESHIVTVCRELSLIMAGLSQLTVINLPPRYGKTTMVVYFVPFGMAAFPDSAFMYLSYGLSLAKEQTQQIRAIIQHPMYKYLFGVSILESASAKHDFKTTKGGLVYASGLGGTITGKGAGVANVDRFGGALIMDDMHKPAEVTSDTMRMSVIDWFYSTVASRLNDPKRTPMLFIGQRLHEEDLPSVFIKEGWKTVIIPALDGAGNALDPARHTVEMLLEMKEKKPYEFASQYQQDPQPSGGAIFKEEWFYSVEKEPKILFTFITVDTAETSKSHNDASVFSFWGLYKVENFGQTTDIWALHWINCIEIRVEPKDLRNEFVAFYHQCLCHEVKPGYVAIEKKSTGVTLLSVLSDMRGIQIANIDRTSASGGKTARFLEAQYYVSSKLISLPMYSRHTRMCIEHCKKITANNAHAHDDIADTMYDAIKIALIDKLFISFIEPKNNANNIIDKMNASFLRQQSLLKNARKPFMR